MKVPKKILLALLVLVLGGLVLVFVLSPSLRAQFLSGEDGWLCQNGEWVKHGNPSGSKPTVPCK